MSKKIEVSPEEAKAEQEALAEAKTEEVRAGIITEYGFDEDTDKETIDKLVEKDLASRKVLSSAIGQKIKYRDQVNESAEPTPEEVEAEKVRVKAEADAKAEAEGNANKGDVSSEVSKQLDERKLQELGYSEELISEIKRAGEISEKPLAEVLKDPYIASKVEQHNADTGNEEAAVSRSNQSGGSKGVKGTFDNPPTPDMNTEEGRKEWDEWKEKMKAEGH